MKHRANDAPDAGDDLPLIFASAFQLPNPRLRSSILRKLDSWVESQLPYFGEDEILDRLDRQRGTEMEPFVLNDQDRKIAAMATRLAFSRLGGDQTRFRIVSRETLGVTGGMVLTDNLGSFFLGRDSRGNHRRISDRTWYIAPAEMEQHEDLSPTIRGRSSSSPAATTTHRRSQLRVTFGSDHQGLYLSISNLPCRQLTDRRTFRPVREFQELGRVLDLDRMDRGRSFNELGLRVTTSGDRIRISTGSPESILRFTAMAAEERILELPTSCTGTPGGRLFIRLCDIEDKPQTLQFVNTVTDASPISSFADTWMCLEPTTSVPLTPTQYLAISRWLAPHDSWITPKLLKELI